jgi:hypothetical protein
MLWEKEDGTAPSVEHMAVVAIVLNVSFEWLATGRGPMRDSQGSELPALIFGDFACSEQEDRLLKLSRRISQRSRVLLLELLEGLSGAPTPKPTSTQLHTEPA